MIAIIIYNLYLQNLNEIERILKGEMVDYTKCISKATFYYCIATYNNNCLLNRHSERNGKNLRCFETLNYAGHSECFYLFEGGCSMDTAFFICTIQKVYPHCSFICFIKIIFFCSSCLNFSFV